MATATPDITKLSYADLLALINTAQEALETKRTNELDVLGNGYVAKLKQMGFTVQEGIDALKPHLGVKTKRVSRGSTSRNKNKPYVAGTVYGNPNGPETWVGGTKGQLPKWLNAELHGLDDAAKATKFSKLAKK